MPVTNLPSIQQGMVRYGMALYLALGILGNICNCIVFMQRAHRRAATSIYFLTLSIFAIIHLIWSIFPNLYALNHVDPQKTSLFYCKVRLYISHVIGLYLRFVIVFACIDRFFLTRRDVRLRSFASVRVAIRLLTMMSIICPLIAVHIPIFMEIRNGVCGIFGLYKLVFAVHQTIFITLIPPILMSVFSFLTIRSLRQRHAVQTHIRHRDRYLLRMVIAEVVVNVSTLIPYSIYVIYGAMTYRVINKSAQRLEIERFLIFVTQFLIYLLEVAPFYLFFLTSKPFRTEFFILIVSCWNKLPLRPIRIAPAVDQNKTTNNT